MYQRPPLPYVTSHLGCQRGQLACGGYELRSAEVKVSSVIQDTDSAYTLEFANGGEVPHTVGPVRENSLSLVVGLGDKQQHYAR